MSDTPTDQSEKTSVAPTVLPPPAEPVQVKENPAKEQLAAALRQLLGGVSLILAALVAAGYVGLSKWVTIVNLALGNVGPIVGVILGGIGLATMIWGNVKTGVLAAKATTMAKMLPDNYAQTKK